MSELLTQLAQLLVLLAVVAFVAELTVGSAPSDHRRPGEE